MTTKQEKYLENGMVINSKSDHDSDDDENNWLAVNELNLTSHNHNPKTILLAMYSQIMVTKMKLCIYIYIPFNGGPLKGT